MNRNPLIFAVFALLSILAVALVVHFIARDVPQPHQDKIQSIEPVKE
jgi:hypothetical protein